MAARGAASVAAERIEGDNPPVMTRTSRFTVPVLVLPGYADSGPDHWQSHWERADPNLRRVVQDDWLEPRLADWVATLDRYVVACGTAPVLVAHSLACSLVAHWAAQPRANADDRPVARGALLVAPADVDSPAHTPDEVREFGPIPIGRLPFPSIVVASTDDPFVTLERAAALARAWGSRLETLERAGHINADAGFGPWPEGQRLLAALAGG
jgi:predicted alpha/beta hydrolase family esterase